VATPLIVSVENAAWPPDSWALQLLRIKLISNSRL